MGVSPCTGTEPSNKICNSARESGALLDTTVKRVCTFVKGGCCDDRCVSEGFCDPLGVAERGEAKNGKQDELELSGEAVKILFFVFMDVSKDSVLRGCNALHGKKIVEVEITAGFTMVIGYNVFMPSTHILMCTLGAPDPQLWC